MNNEEKPAPGSEMAVNLGCLCPIMDNRRGRGLYFDKETQKPVFVISESCPLHGKGQIINLKV
jgi:hypothetical protein